MRSPASKRAGQSRSRLRGPGYEFNSHRKYEIGDDLRRVDWNVSARMQELYLKRHFEENSPKSDHTNVECGSLEAERVTERRTGIQTVWAWESRRSAPLRSRKREQ